MNMKNVRITQQKILKRGIIKINIYNIKNYMELNI